MKIFVKAQLNSVISTLVDFTVTILLKQLVGTWYLLASMLGAITGGITNFLLGRYWVYKASEQQWKKQLARYALIWTGSLLLNTLALYWLTDVLHLHYLLSKTIVTIAVAMGYNFILQKYFVFSA